MSGLRRQDIYASICPVCHLAVDCAEAECRYCGWPIDDTCELVIYDTDLDLIRKTLHPASTVDIAEVEAMPE